MGYVKKLYHKAYDNEDMSYYTYEQILEYPEKIELYYVVLNGRQIVYLISFKEIYNILFLYPFFTERYSKKYTPKAIAEHFKNQKYVVSTSEDMGADYKECNFTTTFDSQSHYSFEGCNMQYVHKTADENVFRDALESIRFPKYDENKIVFKSIKGDAANDYLYDKNLMDYPMYCNENHNYNIIGFHYLKPDFTDCHNLFVAELNGIPIAAIKTGSYYEGKYYAHIGLNFIDVCIPFRKKGLATKIIKEFSKNIKELAFVMSDESDMGKICRMEEHFKKFIPNAYTRKEWDEHCMNLLKKGIE